mmetsp:Transcript_50858/g.157539  ORF Transcript_50858/g.157539 Transcript_50858/m.157539 type:complete len:304 (-) Transcript_50858:326-1237(-)
MEGVALNHASPCSELRGPAAYAEKDIGGVASEDALSCSPLDSRVCMALSTWRTKFRSCLAAARESAMAARRTSAPGNLFPPMMLGGGVSKSSADRGVMAPITGPTFVLALLPEDEAIHTRMVRELLSVSKPCDPAAWRLRSLGLARLCGSVLIASINVGMAMGIAEGNSTSVGARMAMEETAGGSTSSTASALESTFRTTSSVAEFASMSLPGEFVTTITSTLSRWHTSARPLRRQYVLIMDATGKLAGGLRGNRFHQLRASKALSQDLCCSPDLRALANMSASSCSSEGPSAQASTLFPAMV